MEEEKKQTEEKNVLEKVTEEVDKSIKRIMEQGVQTNNWQEIKNILLGD